MNCQLLSQHSEGLKLIVPAGRLQGNAVCATNHQNGDDTKSLKASPSCIIMAEVSVVLASWKLHL